jgi:peptidoglycan/xylan/chitin deacetylase (PgdA/CDA1 family)
MRILHLLSQTELTGAEVYAQTLIESQVRDGHQVFTISDRMHVPLPIPWLSLPLSTSRFFQRLKNIKALRQFLKANRIDVIHCHSRGAVRHAHWARIGLLIAQVTTLHGRQHFSWSKRFMNIYGEILIAICENVKAAMVSDFHIPESPIRIIRNPIAPSSALAPNSVPASASPSTSSAGAASPPPVNAPIPRIALIGRSSGPKGQRFEQIAVGCFEKWLREKPDLQITIIAPSPEKFSSPFHTFIQELEKKHPGSVHVQGHISNLRARLSEFDLVLGSGRVAMECLLNQTSLLAIGEFDSHGILTPARLCEALMSNFGDIGSQETERPLRLDEISREVSEFLQGQRPTASELEILRQRAEMEFSARLIHDDILESYRAAIFKRHVPQWIPVLMYHKIPDQTLASRHRIFVTKEKFQQHLRFFQSRHFHSLTFQDLMQFWTGKRDYSEFPKKPLILTFDDGYRDNLINAQSLLKQSGYRAVIFLLANHSIIENTWDADTGETPSELMTLPEKLKLDSQVWEIGSHGFNHLHLTKARDPEIRLELQESKLSLKRDLQQPVYSFAYPFGSTNAHIASLAREAGYKFAVNTDQGGLHLADDPHSIFRVNIFPEDGPFELWKKTSPWYRRYFYRKRGR